MEARADRADRARRTSPSARGGRAAPRRAAARSRRSRRYGAARCDRRPPHPSSSPAGSARRARGRRPAGGRSSRRAPARRRSAASAGSHERAVMPISSSSGCDAEVGAQRARRVAAEREARVDGVHQRLGRDAGGDQHLDALLLAHEHEQRAVEHVPHEQRAAGARRTGRTTAARTPRARPRVRRPRAGTARTAGSGSRPCRRARTCSHRPSTRRGRSSLRPRPRPRPRHADATAGTRARASARSGRAPSPASVVAPRSSRRLRGMSRSATQRRTEPITVSPSNVACTRGDSMPETSISTPGNAARTCSMQTERSAASPPFSRTYAFAISTFIGEAYAPTRGSPTSSPRAPASSASARPSPGRRRRAPSREPDRRAGCRARP